MIWGKKKGWYYRSGSRWKGPYKTREDAITEAMRAGQNQNDVVLKEIQ